MVEKLFQLKDENIANRDEYDRIKGVHDLLCTMCSCILIKPKQCKKCEMCFCEECINSWVSKKNSCPQRCQDFKIDNANQIIRNMLDSMKFKCTKCFEIFSYVRIIDHEPQCKGENHKPIKCPICKGCDIPYGDKKIYDDNLLSDLKTEIALLKENPNTELINLKREIDDLRMILKAYQTGEFESTSNIPIGVNPKFPPGNDNEKRKLNIKWATKQKKPDFTLSEGNKKLKVKYSGCNNIYLADYTFEEDIDLEFLLTVCSSSKLNSHYIGFINSEYNLDDCLCINNQAWCICGYGESFKHNGLILFDDLGMAMETNVPKTFLFTINGAKGILVLTNYETKKVIGSIQMYGKKFRFFVSKCNRGEVEYSLF